MAKYLISSKSNGKFIVRLGDCSKSHAESVLTSLKDNPSCPDDIYLRRQWRRNG